MLASGADSHRSSSAIDVHVQLPSVSCSWPNRAPSARIDSPLATDTSRASPSPVGTCTRSSSRQRPGFAHVQHLCFSGSAATQMIWHGIGDGLWPEPGRSAARAHWPPRHLSSQRQRRYATSVPHGEAALSTAVQQVPPPAPPAVPANEAWAC